jgi:hypothetical protein
MHFATETITAEHHPRRHGMPYLLRIVGGKHHNIEIRCATRQSVENLFTEVVAARRTDTEHPYLRAV